MRSLLVLSVALAALLGTAHAGCTVSGAQCYVDDSNRILGPVDENGSQNLFNAWCAQLCSDDGYTLAGTEDGNQCFCGNTIRPDAQKAPQTDCSMPCQGYANETCGAAWRISIFAVNCSGTPVPPPPELPFLVNPCLNTSGPYYLMPFCNSSLPIDDRVDDAVSRMSLSEKINNLVNGASAIPSLGLPAYNWWSEASHGVASGRVDQKTRWTTNFAFPITTAMSFNRSLWYYTGSQIGREARAMMNAGNGYSTFWAPVINLARDPRWGRNLETPGEDPYLSGEYAKFFVKGMQESPDDPFHIQASACCKHYVANEMDDSTEVGVHHWRDEFDAQVPMQDLVDSYLLPFQACVEVGRVSGLMCSYNAVNGVPSCANGWLLDTVARKEWGFDGYITSDCDADADVFSPHNYTATPEETVRDVLRAGTDVDCGGFVSTYAQSALDKGLITEDDIDERLRKLFRVRFRLSHFDPVGPLDMIPLDAICSNYSIALARDGAAQGSTLIKNDDNTLPLSPSLSSVAVIGPLCNYSYDIAGYYGPTHVCFLKYWNMVDAVQQYVPNTSYLQGVPSVTSNDTSQIPDAVALAQSVDQVVLVVGTDLSVAAEGHDAISIAFSDGQRQLIEKVAAAASKPIVVVTMTAVPLDLSDLLANKQIGAILHVGQPSVTTLGIGDVLFNTKVPAGRLVQTILPSSYTGEISIFDFNMRPGPSAYPRPDCTTPIAQCPNGTNPGRTHRFYTGDAVVPFGFGLSYTTFEYQIIQGPSSSSVSLDRVRQMLDQTAQEGRMFPSLTALGKEAPLITYAVNVTNTGAIDADDVVLGFFEPPGAGIDGVPLQVLFGFERVHVPAGQTVTVWLMPGLLDFTVVDELGARRAQPGQYKVHFGVAETSAKGQGYAEDSFLAV